jgi:carbon monoxide dehydrogenase subunit G
MKFSSHYDIKLAQDVVFDRLSEFEKFERLAVKRGLRVRRIDESDDIAEGIKWRLEFPFRGKKRNVELTLVEADVPNSLVFDAQNPSVAGKIRVDVIPLSRTQTRLKFESVVQPKTLAARLMVHSMKLARSKFNRRFPRRVELFAEKLEIGFD